MSLKTTSSLIQTIMSPDSLLHTEDKHFKINLGDSILYDKPVANATIKKGLKKHCLRNEITRGACGFLLCNSEANLSCLIRNNGHSVYCKPEPRGQSSKIGGTLDSGNVKLIA